MNGSGAEDQIVSVLKQHGFNATEAKAYVSLLKGHPATGYEISARSGVPRSAIYSVLRRLEQTGAVQAVTTKPAKYSPIAPSKLMSMLSERFERSLQTLKTSFEQLDDTVDETATITIQGYQTVLDHAESLIESATESLHLSVWRRECLALAEPLKRTHQHAIEPVLFSFTSIPHDLGLVLSYELDEAKLEQHWEHKIIIIADKSRALISGSEQNDETRGIVTEERAVVEMALNNLILDITLFGERNDVETEEVVLGLTTTLAPIGELMSG